MTRRTILTALTGLLLLAGLGAPAMADPGVDSERESVCIRVDPQGGRDGFCVWVGLPDRP